MIVPVILSGGAGTRLWPVSREDHPKPFMRLPDGQSLLQKTYLRAASLIAEGGEIVTVTNREHYFESRDNFAQASLSRHRARFLLEPQGRIQPPPSRWRPWRWRPSTVRVLCWWSWRRTT